MNNDEWFIIKDLEEFINASRRLVFQNFGLKSDYSAIDIDQILNSEDQKEMDSILSYSESLSIAIDLLKKQKRKIDPNQIRYLLNEERYMKILQSMNDRMVSNILNNLVNKGLIETAYDEKSNDFVFWTVENDKEKNQS